MSYGEPNIATKYLLFRLCRGRCYKPGCTKPVVKLVNGQAQTAAKIAHIYGRRPNAARYDPRILEPQLKSFANVLLLCAEHHDVVDGPVTQHEYPAELLKRWKREREDLDSLPPGALDEIDDATLLSQMTTAVNDTRGEILQALTDVPGEIASLLRSMVDDTFTGPYMDTETVYVLDSAARMLVHLQDTAPQLNAVARELSVDSDYIHRLQYLIGQMTEITGQASSTVTDWETATSTAPSSSAWTSSLDRAIGQLDARISALQEYEPPPLELDREDFWWAIRKGLGWGALGGAVLAAFVTAWITVWIMQRT
ncbi:hypothetical protein GCM10029964_061420 [Kibdelosporangium lantanae]